ncbi:cob(I)yrinic acid a,c-diamide adenosyltransferase [bacterium]|nr:cob(I)yrinic acid a,c-diamide adenosyltransferase [bacterium]MBU1636826.1 cob(I)yrinic acid a,c-diamide adenosyltransferase [bacterium]MBU1920182.1 cob(I)yrinic acid a,c-diamide adenosyltransferase [bacterium]RQW00006.1 MAG: cob(I)yrinic acid a,c-diamide adenosyltransferase [bacterium]
MKDSPESTIASEQTEPSRGLVLVNTGDGKGKTTAALGTVLRAVGYGHRVLIVQFIKGSWMYGEMKSIKRLEPEVEFHRMGKGFVGIIDDELPREQHEAAAREALAFAKEKLSSGDYKLVLLDEIFIAVGLGLFGVQDVLDLLDVRPEQTTLILTGRGAPQEVIERADTVTEMKEIKHAYRSGILAQRGVDY